MAQPNMGQRKLYSTRLPLDIAERFEAEVSTTDLSFTQFIADLLADRYGLPRPSKRFPTKRERMALGQEVLPLDRAS